MASTAPVQGAAQAPLRIRIFVDFWNFQLSLRREDEAFKVDWKPVAGLLVGEAEKLLNAPVTYEAMHVYGSYDPNKPNDLKFRNWFTTWLDKQPGVHTVLVERQKKRNHPKCPVCQADTKTCHACGGDMRGTEEKGVDTRIATDLISLAWSNGYDVAIVLSADRDFVPVADFLQSKGIKLIHAAFPPKGSQLSQRCWGNFSVTKLMEQFRLN